ncbi:MAG TPA: DUF2293 domain-containing protein, partial [Candidatus Paceibacterota bacterium]|nr:DUF2293 domain-containing protein [Candidatus Paceibacterota bacterium]
VRLFPGCPPELKVKIVLDAVYRHNSCVHNMTLSWDRKAELVFEAWSRHNCTSYDSCLDGGTSRSKARRDVVGMVSFVLSEWRKSKPKQA